jgi:hypothetical protein
MKIHHRGTEATETTELILWIRSKSILCVLRDLCVSVVKGS